MLDMWVTDANKLREVAFNAPPIGLPFPVGAQPPRVDFEQSWALSAKGDRDVKDPASAPLAWTLHDKLTIRKLSGRP